MSLLFILIPSLTGSTSFMIIPSGGLAIGIAFLFYRQRTKALAQETDLHMKAGDKR